jgi:hypothetical protein
MTDTPISIADAVAAARKPDAQIAPAHDAPPSFLEALAQEGFSALGAAMASSEHDSCADQECCACPPPLWVELPEMERRAFTAFAAAVVAACDAAKPLQTVTYDAHGYGRASPPASTTAPFKPRNMVDVLAEREYPEAQEGAARPSPGAAVRQLCRSIDAAPHLKRLLEDLLSAQNRASHEFSRERDSRKRLELLADGFANIALRSFVAARTMGDKQEAQPVAIDYREESRRLLEGLDALENTLSSAPPDAVSRLAVTLANWSAVE